MAKVSEGVVLAGLSGRTGNAVFVRTPGGTVLRDRPLKNDPRTSAQQANRQRMAAVGRAWQNLSRTQAQAWRDYALRLPADSRGAKLSGQRAFSQLAMRFLAVNPNGSIPVWPPSSVFPGDAVRFSLGADLNQEATDAAQEPAREMPTAQTEGETPTPHFAAEPDESFASQGGTRAKREPESPAGKARARTAAQTEGETPTPHFAAEPDESFASQGGTRAKQEPESPAGKARARTAAQTEGETPSPQLGAGGAVLLTADRANTPGVVTEVLLQRLPGRNCRTYLEKYRSAGFFAFSQGQTRALPVAPGVYAVATRFLFAATGEATDLIEQGVVLI